MQTKLTTRATEALRRQSQQLARDLFLWDTELRGFGAKATAKGHLSWLVQKWQGGRGGKAVRIVIGHAPPMTVDEARIQASSIISDWFKDIPLVGRKERVRQAKLAKLRSSNLHDAIALFLEMKRKPGSYWDEIARSFERDVLPELGGDTIVSEITKQEIRQLIEDKQTKAPAAARNLFAALRPFFNWCVERDWIAVSPVKDISAPAKVDARDRVLTEAEVKTFWQATDNLPVYGPCFRLLLLTAQRRDEVGGMSWSELDLEKAEWIIPKERTKNGKEHLVHLSPQALAILKAIPKQEGALVFSTQQGTPIKSYSRAKISLDQLMPGVADWRLHDLRRTAASGMASLGFQPHIIERVLNHVSGAQGGLVGVYQRYEYAEERKRAIYAWNNHLDSLVSTEKVVSNVVNLRS